MPGTQIIFERKKVVIDGENKWQVSATCIDEGDLPDSSIFLLEITQEEDPKDDTLKRLCNLQDFDTYERSRPGALNLGFVQWRSTSVSLYYDNLETASIAYKELSARINTLVEDNDVFLEEFSTPDSGETVTFPTVDISTKTALEEAARAAEAAIEEREEERDALQQDCTALETEVEVLEDRLSEAKGDLDSITNAIGEVSPIETALSTDQSSLAAARTTIRINNNSSSATASEIADIETQLRSQDTSLLDFATQNDLLDTFISSTLSSIRTTLQDRVSTLTADRNAKVLELSRCNTELSRAQGAVDAARDARDAALADVLEVCPDFTL